VPVVLFLPMSIIAQRRNKAIVSYVQKIFLMDFITKGGGFNGIQQTENSSEKRKEKFVRSRMPHSQQGIR